ncbi:MAG: hypothetical protein M3Y07_13045 [Acidobacteriota bacterium]|nr:hypothetical protein [Acidobacteriota bacterium]
MRQGDLSASPTPLYDPFTGAADGSGRMPFAGNRIPQSRFDPAAAKIVPLWPSPNLGTAKDQTNYYASGPFSLDRQTFDTKVNWNASNKFNMYGRYSMLDFTTFQAQYFGDALGGPAVNGGTPGNGYGKVYNATPRGHLCGGTKPDFRRLFRRYLDNDEREPIPVE